MIVLNGGTIYSGQSERDRQSCAFPHLCVTSSGRWVCSFRAAPAKESTSGQQVLVTWSDDQGRSWSSPISPFPPHRVGRVDGVFRGAFLSELSPKQLVASLFWVDQSDSSRPLFNKDTEGLLDCRIFLSVSQDDGRTWSTPGEVNTTFNAPTPVTGPVLQLSNGDLACQFEVNKHYHDTAPWKFSSVLLLSSDGGKTWPRHVITACDPARRMFYWDQRPGVLADGTILDLFWAYDNHDFKYLNIHARSSTDHGKTWSEMWDTQVPGQPGAPVSTPDGGVVMVYIDRTGAPALKIRKSRDGGRTWPAGSETTLYGTDLPSQTLNKASMQDTWRELGQYSIGFPAASVLDDGRILVVYYAGKSTDQTDIRWCLVEKWNS
ncbi:MAG: exo-alpha-sialidase [Phycisphaerales bacterium]|nr:exo-alpha-sialidase [Phycisphaerales bacterium]